MSFRISSSSGFDSVLDYYIYTGLNPAEHGVLESIDYLDFKNKVKGDYSVIQGHSFWDVLSEEGKKYSFLIHLWHIQLGMLMD